MSITVTGRKMPVTDALREYAEEKIGNSMKVMDIDPLVAAIDVAAAKVVRQLRKYKTKVVDRKLRAADETIRIEPSAAGELDVDGLMQELSDDEVVRVKTIEFEPLTEEEALVKIDLLGHDFFAYTDRDSGMVNVLYRRDDGGYGLLKQAEE